MARGKRANLEGRNGQIWREYVRGATQEQLAEEHGLSRGRVSQIITEVADSIPERQREQLITEELEHLRSVRAEIMELWDHDGAPVTVRAGEGWDYVHDPDTGALVRDHAGRLHAARLALAYTERMHRVLGLDAATQVDVGVSEEAAARLAAAEALAHLHGGQGGEVRE